MKIIQIRMILLVFAAIIFTSCSKEEEGLYFNEITETKIEYSSLEIEILDLVNNYRVSKELPKLEKLDVVSSVALSHSKYMAEMNQINHNNFNERQEQLSSLANAKVVGENVAYGYNTAKGVLASWLNSDSHKALIENASFTHFGISTAKDASGKNYFTQIFIKR